MADSKLVASEIKLPPGASIIGAERIASDFATAKAVNSVFTVPARTNVIVLIPAAAAHWHPTGTPTSSYGHVIGANKLAALEHNQKAAKLILDAGAGAVIAVYFA
jgi:hypothetical protein